jgi:leucyl-tRNA synthetase
LSDSPPEKDVQWSDDGIEAAHKFIQKLWVLHQKICIEINKNNLKDNSQNLEKFTSKFIKNITHNLNNFNYNIVIANLHELHTFLSKEIKNPYKKETLLKNYKKILICITPIIPHLSNEALNDIDSNQNIQWPT